MNRESLEYFNGYGGFSKDGKEYHIIINKTRQLPIVWSHIMSNEKFGTLVTENMGGYTWYKNCRLNRLTNWGNQPILDVPSEAIYMVDKENGKSWSLGFKPKADEQHYHVVYGFGYCKYIHENDGIEQDLTVFVPKNDSVKVQILKLTNKNLFKKKLKIFYYAKPVLDENELNSDRSIKIDFDEEKNLIYLRNHRENRFSPQIMYVGASEKIKSYTGNKKFFFGDGGVANPEGIKLKKLKNEDSFGVSSCVVYEVEINLESMSEKEIVFVLGAEENSNVINEVWEKYSDVNYCKREFEKIKNYWKDYLAKLQVYTPIDSLNILLNGWLIYQVMTSRILARTGFYQSGGAFGFRDQLQDILALKYLDEITMKNQIIRHCKHQFKEGDVEHWWHEDVDAGIRTRFSDDLLWLVYAVFEYVESSGDTSILDEKVAYLDGAILEEGESEKYDNYYVSDCIESVFEHCKKAIEKSLNFGINGLPKIGSGDWNDGLSNVGPNGKGESVWLAFFLYDILGKFIELCKIKNQEEDIEKYENIRSSLKENIDKNAWDGKWYKRAFTDDGGVLGSEKNDECKIDSISQSWSVISGAGNEQKCVIAMESFEKFLVDKDEAIIKLLTPPFENGSIEPGYIKAYLPGVRENGGQYTHAAIWAIMAYSMLGLKNKAVELYKLINPIEHSKTKELADKYKVEPYVIAADVYSNSNLKGRGGWTWYTGSASWYYKVFVENIVGLKIKSGVMSFCPCISDNWENLEIQYKWKDSIYNIKIKNKKNLGSLKVLQDGKEIENNIILRDKGLYNIEIII